MSCTCISFRASKSSRTKAVDSVSSHRPLCSQVSMKCPWEYRVPFLDERQNKMRKRKLRHDPVDPLSMESLEPKLLNGKHPLIEADEFTSIHLEIKRLRAVKGSMKLEEMFADISDRSLRTSIAEVIQHWDYTQIDSQRDFFDYDKSVADVDYSSFSDSDQNVTFELMSDQYDGYLACQGEDEPLTFSSEDEKDPN